jgi:hypothetical protein
MRTALGLMLASLLIGGGVLYLQRQAACEPRQVTKKVPYITPEMDWPGVKEVAVWKKPPGC